MELQGASAMPYLAGAAAARKPSMAGSMVSSTTAAGGRKLFPEFE
jgi:hypothetical protein